MGRVLPGGASTLVGHLDREDAAVAQQRQAVGHQRRKIRHVLEHVVGVDRLQAAVSERQRAQCRRLHRQRKLDRLRQVQHQVRIGALVDVDVDPARQVVLAAAQIHAAHPQRGLRGRRRAPGALDRLQVGDQFAELRERVARLEAAQHPFGVRIETGRAKRLADESGQLVGRQEEDRVLEMRRGRGGGRAFRNDRRAEREAMRDPDLLEAGQLVVMQVQHGLRLPDELIALGSEQGLVEQRDLATGRLDRCQQVGAPVVDDAEEQQVERSLGQRQRRRARPQERGVHDRDHGTGQRRVI